MNLGRRHEATHNIFLMFIYFERERERQRERGRERISGRLHAVSAEPNSGLDLTNHEIVT